MVVCVTASGLHSLMTCRAGGCVPECIHASVCERACLCGMCCGGRVCVVGGLPGPQLLAPLFPRNPTPLPQQQLPACDDGLKPGETFSK